MRLLIHFKWQKRRDATHILENLLDCDLEDEYDSAFMEAFLELNSIDVIDGMMTLLFDNLQTLY